MLLHVDRPALTSSQKTTSSCTRARWHAARVKVAGAARTHALGQGCAGHCQQKRRWDRAGIVISATASQNRTCAHQTSQLFLEPGQACAARCLRDVDNYLPASLRVGRRFETATIWRYHVAGTDRLRPIAFFAIAVSNTSSPCPGHRPPASPALAPHDAQRDRLFSSLALVVMRAAWIITAVRHTSRTGARCI